MIVIKSKQHFFCFLVLGLFWACRQESNPQKLPKPADLVGKSSQIKKQFMEANKLLMQKENDEMDAYEKTHKMFFVKTNSGIRYYVYKHSAKGDSICKKMEIQMEYDVSLLDGTKCYSSKTEGIKHLVIENEEAESGIHKGLQYLKRGDKAIFLIPSVLAHGLLGDLKKIPPQTPIVYNVSIY